MNAAERIVLKDTDTAVSVWDSSVPVEKSSYLRDDAIKYINLDGFSLQPGKLPMLDLFCGAGGFAVGAE